MNSIGKTTLVCCLAAVAAVGVTVGVYYGVTAPAIAARVPSGDAVTPEIAALFAEDHPTGVTQFLDGSNDGSKALLLSGYRVYLEDTSVKAFYYRCRSEQGFGGKVTFDIGIKNDVVAYYSFVKSTEDEQGTNWARTTKDFIGYDGSYEVVATGATVEETPGAMQSAVDAALKDAKGRE